MEDLYSLQLHLHVYIFPTITLHKTFMMAVVVVRGERENRSQFMSSCTEEAIFIGKTFVKKSMSWRLGLS